MSGLFSSTPVASTRRLPGERDDEAVRTADSWFDQINLPAVKLRREGKEQSASLLTDLSDADAAWDDSDSSLVLEKGENRASPDGSPLSIASMAPATRRAERGGFDAESSLSSVAPLPSPESIRAPTHGSAAVTTPIARQFPVGQRPAVPAEDRPDTREFGRVMEITLGNEGGTAPDQGGLTHKGLSQNALDDLVRQDPKRWDAIRDKNAKDPKAIPSTQVPEDVMRGIYYWHYFIRPQFDHLAAVPGLAEMEPQLAAQMFDAQVQHWGNVQHWLKQSLNEAGLPPDQFNPDEVKKIVDKEAVKLGIPTTSMESIRNNLMLGADGKYRLKDDAFTGPVVRAAVLLALQAGKIHQVNDRIVELRLSHVKNRPDFKGLSRRIRRLSSNGPAPTYGPYGKNGIRPY